MGPAYIISESSFIITHPPTPTLKSPPPYAQYTTGAAGAGLDGTSLYPSDYIEKTILGKWGYSVLHANASTLTLEFHENADDEVLDFVALTK